MSKEGFFDERDWEAGGVPQPAEKTVYLVFSIGQVEIGKASCLNFLYLSKSILAN